jgi:2-polyprenyl-3-methyl-5-hydroxy-6-metoxy-1,4-benzoquinol methylase
MRLDSPKLAAYISQMDQAQEGFPAPQTYAYTGNAREDILRMIPPDGKVIGSVGCGHGLAEAVLVRQGRQVHGIDISPEAVRLASAHLTSVRLVEPGAFDFFEPRSLDGLILADVIEHMPSAWTALQKLSTFVKPGGWIVISVPNMRHYSALCNLLVKGDWPEHDIGIFDATHLQVVTRKRLYRWCAQANLDVEQRFPVHYVLRRPRLGKVVRWVDNLSLRLFTDFLQFQIQVRCRVRA